MPRNSPEQRKNAANFPRKKRKIPKINKNSPTSFCKSQGREKKLRTKCSIGCCLCVLLSSKCNRCAQGDENEDPEKVSRSKRSRIRKRRQRCICHYVKGLQQRRSCIGISQKGSPERFRFLPISSVFFRYFSAFFRFSVSSFFILPFWLFFFFRGPIFSLFFLFLPFFAVFSRFIFRKKRGDTVCETPFVKPRL